jgi:uncharacterized protein (DUF1015 family)
VPRVFPFEGLVYDPAVVGPLGRVTAPPYDVISDARLRGYRSSPHNVVHVDLAEEEPEGGSDRYARAALLLETWRRQGALVPAGSSAFYAYEMRFSLGGLPRQVRGLLCALELEDWGRDVVPHERTTAGPIEDRLRLLRATRTHLSAIYGTIPGPLAPLAEMLDDVTGTAPRLEAHDEEGVAHRLWTIPTANIGRWLAGERLLIADGHHRYMTALRYRNEMRAARGPGPWDRTLTFVVDASVERPPVLPFHRIQLDGPLPPAGGEALDDLTAALSDLSDDDVVVALATRDGEGTVRYRLLSLDGEAPAVRALHGSLLDELVPADALRFRPSVEEAVAAVASGGAVAAYLLPATTTDRIRKVVERGQRLPQKSTYFWPKPRTGMMLMPLES